MHAPFFFLFIAAIGCVPLCERLRQCTKSCKLTLTNLNTFFFRGAHPPQTLPVPTDAKVVLVLNLCTSFFTNSGPASDDMCCGRKQELSWGEKLSEKGLKCEVDLGMDRWT